MLALINACQSQEIRAEVVAVISNRPDAEGLKLAKSLGVDTVSVDHKLYEERERFDQELLARIESHKPDVLVLAGFMRILSEDFVQNFAGRMINLHPSLLPKYKGLNTHQRALDARDDYAGASLHFVTAELDGGPVIMQVTTPILPNETAQSLADKILPLEHAMLIQAVEMLSQSDIKLVGNSVQLCGSSDCLPLRFTHDVSET